MCYGYGSTFVAQGPLMLVFSTYPDHSWSICICIYTYTYDIYIYIIHTYIYTIVCTHTCFLFFKCTYILIHMVPLFAISKKVDCQHLLFFLGGWEPDTPPQYPGYPWPMRGAGVVSLPGWGNLQAYEWTKFSNKCNTHVIPGRILYRQHCI